MDVCANAEAAIKALVLETQNILTVFGAPIYIEGNLYNCAVVVKDKKIIGITAKKHLAREGIHYEPRWFTPWEKGASIRISYADQDSIDFGDLYFKIGKVGLGIEICDIESDF